MTNPPYENEILSNDTQYRLIGCDSFADEAINFFVTTVATGKTIWWNFKI